MSEVKMGLGGAPDPIYLHVSESIDEGGEVHPWHMWDGKKQIPVKDRSLTGILTNIRLKLGPEFKGRRPVKIQLRVDTGSQPYVMQAGVETTFTRGMLLALDMVDDLTQPFMFVVANGGEKVVFARLHLAANGERVKIMWDKERKLFPLVQKLQQKLGLRPQSWEDVQATGNYEARDDAPEQVEQEPEPLEDAPF